MFFSKVLKSGVDLLKEVLTPSKTEFSTSRIKGGSRSPYTTRCSISVRLDTIDNAKWYSVESLSVTDQHGTRKRTRYNNEENVFIAPEGWEHDSEPSFVDVDFVQEISHKTGSWLDGPSLNNQREHLVTFKRKFNFDEDDAAHIASLKEYVNTWSVKFVQVTYDDTTDERILDTQVIKFDF